MKDTDRKRILIIEDDAHIAEGLRLNLSFKGHDVAIALDGLSGLQGVEGVETGPDRAWTSCCPGSTACRSCETSGSRTSGFPSYPLGKERTRVPGQGACLRRGRLPVQTLQPRRVPAAGRAAPDAGRLGRRGRSFPGEPFHGGAGVHLRQQRASISRNSRPDAGWARSA